MPTMDEVRSMLVWGAVGGMLPTLGKIAGTFGANFDAPSPQLRGVAIALALYGVIGAVVSRAIGNPEVRQAMFAGIAAPAIVVSVLAGATDSSSIRHVAGSGGASNGFGLISSALAQAPPRPAEATTPYTLSLSAAGVPVSGTIQVSAIAPGRAPVRLQTVDGIPGHRDVVLQIPNDATELLVDSADGQSVRVPIAHGGQNRIAVTVVPKTGFGTDLLWALGGTRKFGVGEIKSCAVAEGGC